MAKLIKIYGERNTNTNYMSQLIKLNLQAQEVPGVVPQKITWLQRKLPGRERVRDAYFRLTYTRNLGWKHTRVEPVGRLFRTQTMRSGDVAFVTITKNPYSWLLSLYRRPYHQYDIDKSSFERFLSSPWRTVGRDNTLDVLDSPVELWNIKNRSYLQLSTVNGLNLRTEELFDDPAAVIDRIAGHFGIAKKSESFVNYERSTKNTNVDGNYYRDYYVNEKWREELSQDAIAIINEAVDKQLMTQFGYELLA